MIPKIKSRIKIKGGAYTLLIKKALVDTDVVKPAVDYNCLLIPDDIDEHQAIEYHQLINEILSASRWKKKIENKNQPRSALGYKHNLVSVWSLPSVRLVGSPRTQMFNKAFNSKVVS